MSEIILSNQVVCHACGESPYSAHRHDFRYCSCGGVAVDGGMAYLRRIGSNYTDKSITVDKETHELMIDAIADPSKNNLGKLCNVVRVLRDHLGINLTEYCHEKEALLKDNNQDT